MYKYDLADMMLICVDKKKTWIHVHTVYGIQYMVYIHTWYIYNIVYSMWYIVWYMVCHV